MSTEFQWVIDNASSISMNRMKTVSSTTARDGTVRATSRGGQPWVFDVRLPDGPRWTDYRQQISVIESADRTTVTEFSLSDTGHDWLVGYQGNAANIAAITASWTAGDSEITLTGGQATSGYNFRAGDFIQLPNRSVYTVSADVAFNSNTVPLHRPIRDTSGSGTLLVAENCVWSVICTQFPQWTLFARDQISWSGSFVFVEDLT